MEISEGVLMKMSEEYRITLIDDINKYDLMLEQMTQEASQYGIIGVSISPNGRVISVEIDDECSGIRDIVSWLAATLPFVELIGQVVQIDTYEPRWTEEDETSNVIHIDFE